MIHLPDLEAPRPVAEATEALQTAQARLDDARRARQEAEAGLREAAALDKQALADRLAQDPQARPSREHRDRAEAELTEAVEVEDACSSNLEAATERAASTALEHVGAWLQAVEEARTKADATFARAVAKLKDAEQARAALRGTAAWLKQLEAGGELFLRGGAGGTVKASRGAQPLQGQLDAKDPRHSDARLSVAYALDLLAQYGEATSVAGEAEAEQRRAEAERAAEARRERIQAMRSSGDVPPA